jgi:hypothetical protein
MAPMAMTDPILHWTEALTGLQADRVVAARGQLAEWDIEHLNRELLADTVDSAVASTLLVESSETIASHGVPPERLRKKLRQDKQFWGTWAEFRAAEILLRWFGDEAEIHLEEGRSRGTHADFRIVAPQGEPARSFEVKAIGLSDEEVAFCERMAPSLKRLTPKVGLTHIHAPIEGKPPRLTREQRRHGERESRRRIKQVPRYPTGLRGAVIVGHGSERSYTRRVAARVEQAVRQLPTHDECWVAIYWSNGAPASDVAGAVRWSEIPSYVAGIVLLGCGVAFPHRQIHCFTSFIPRDHPLEAERAFRSQEEGMEEFAELVLSLFERSSGVRATLCMGPSASFSSAMAAAASCPSTC